MQRKEKVVELIYKTKIERNQHFPEKASEKIMQHLELKFKKPRTTNI